MGDMGEIFNEWSKVKKDKKRSNQRQSTEMLINAGAKFQSKNGGNHLIVEGRNGLIDYWPSTGKFIERGGAEGRGIKKLIRKLHLEDPKREV